MGGWCPYFGRLQASKSLAVPVYLVAIVAGLGADLGCLFSNFGTGDLPGSFAAVWCWSAAWAMRAQIANTAPSAMSAKFLKNEGRS